MNAEEKCAEQCAQESPAMRLLTDMKDAENALLYINREFGNNTWHEYQKIRGYLEGKISGLKYSMRVFDL